LRAALISGIYPELPSITEFGTTWEGIPYVPRIEISAEQGPFRFKPKDHGASRVREGDVIGYDGEFPLLSPVTGIADYIPEKDTFLLRLEGNLKIGRSSLSDEDLPHRQIRNAPDPRGEFIRRVREAGIAALDYRPGPLFQKFSALLEIEKPTIILSLIDPSSAFGWRQIFGQRFIFLQQFLKDIFPNAKVVTIGKSTLLPENVRDPENYGKSLPPVLIKKIKKRFSFNASPEEQGICYLGPRTLFALGEFLLDGKPFTSHPVAFLFQKPGDVKTRIFRLPNGFPLSSIFEEFPSESMRAIYSGNLIEGIRMDGADPGNYSIFGSSVFYLLRDHLNHRGAVRACNGCMRCNSICPVGANPHAMLYRPQLFRDDLCIHCDLCNFVCESCIEIIGKT
jgi:ferredoxin